MTTTPPPSRSGPLRVLEVEPPDGDGFRAELHRRLAAAGPPPPPSLRERWRVGWARHAGVLWPAAGVLAGIATFALLFATRPPVARPQAAPPAASAQAQAAAESVHRIPADRVAVIRVNFAAEIAIEDVDFEVRVPDGLAFWSEGQRLAERAFRWRGSLSAGDNPLPIAVRGERPGRYRVVATAEVAGRRVQHDVLLEVTGA